MKKPSGLIEAQAAGRNGDTILAHINPTEAEILKDAGGSGTINPKTGLIEFGFFTDIRDAFESVAVVVGNYYLPGSSVVTSGLASKGSQKQLGSTLGQIATMGSGVAGAAAGNLSNYGKLLNSVGLDAVTKGIDNVGSYLSKTLNTLSSAASEAIGGSTAASTETTARTAAGNAVASGEDLSVAQVAAQNSGAVPETAAQLATGAKVVGDGVKSASTGLIGKALDWASKNPVPALMAGQTAMATIGGMGTAEANRQAAEANRQAQLALPGVQKAAAMVPGAWSGSPPITPNDPQQALTVDGKYLYGPLAGQYAPGRGPGLTTSR